MPTMRTVAKSIKTPTHRIADHAVMFAHHKMQQLQLARREFVVTLLVILVMAVAIATLSMDAKPISTLARPIAAPVAPFAPHRTRLQLPAPQELVVTRLVMRATVTVIAMLPTDAKLISILVLRIAALAELFARHRMRLRRPVPLELVVTRLVIQAT